MFDLFKFFFEALFGFFATGAKEKKLASKIAPVPTPQVVAEMLPPVAKLHLQASEVRALAKKVVFAHFPQVDVDMIVAMAKIESSFKTKAQRYEKHLNDHSVGLMQTLVKTALWLYQDMGATAYGKPTFEKLQNPEISIYFGAAYVNWLRRYKGKTRSEEWIVRAYNGGQGWARSNTSKRMTSNHWRKYQKAKREIQW